MSLPPCLLASGSKLPTSMTTGTRAGASAPSAAGIPAGIVALERASILLHPRPSLSTRRRHHAPQCDRRAWNPRSGARGHESGSHPVDGDLRRVDSAAHRHPRAPLGRIRGRRRRTWRTRPRRRRSPAPAGRPRDIDAIIFATLSPDFNFPGDGCFLGAKLGIPGVPGARRPQPVLGLPLRAVGRRRLRSAPASTSASCWSAPRCTRPGST